MVFLCIIANEYQGGIPPPSLLRPDRKQFVGKRIANSFLCVSYQRHKEKVLKGGLLKSRVDETIIQHRI